MSDINPSENEQERLVDYRHKYYKFRKNTSLFSWQTYSLFYLHIDFLILGAGFKSALGRLSQDLSRIIKKTGNVLGCCSFILYWNFFNFMQELYGELFRKQYSDTPKLYTVATT